MRGRTPQIRSAPVVSTRPNVLTRETCFSVVDRSRFGHLSFVIRGHVQAVPIRFRSVQGWLYFTATAALRNAIAHTPWVAVTIEELTDSTEMTSVVARGGCYPAERTGSPAGDARALDVIVQLRDRIPGGSVRTRRSQRTSVVFRMYLEELRGRRVPLPG